MIIPVLAFSFGWPLLVGTVLSFVGFSYYYMEKNISQFFLIPVFMLFAFSMFLISYEFSRAEIRYLSMKNYISSCTAVLAGEHEVIPLRDLKKTEDECKKIRF